MDFKNLIDNNQLNKLDMTGIEINKNLFIRNTADKGGAIFFENLLPYMTSSLNMSLFGNRFYNNTAHLGSSLFYQNVVP